MCQLLFSFFFSLLIPWAGKKSGIPRRYPAHRPHYMHQVWRDGRNIIRRVRASEAAQLREGIDNAKGSAELPSELARINIARILQLRSAEAAPDEIADANKTPCRRASRRPHRDRSLHRQRQREAENARARRKPTPPSRRPRPISHRPV